MFTKLYQKLFQRVTVQQLKEQELYTAQCSLLQAQSQLEYFQAMAEFNKQRIQRLRLQYNETPTQLSAHGSGK